MENNNEKQLSTQSDDKGALWAILMTIAMIVIMAVLKQFLG